MVTTTRPSPKSTRPELLDAARGIAAFSFANAPALDVFGSYPAEEMAQLGEAGLLAAPLAISRGGLGLGFEPGGMRDLLRLLTILGTGNLSVARLYEGHVDALRLIQQFGAPAQFERVAADVRGQHSIFAVWSTEGAGGVRIDPHEDGSFRLHGTKIFASGAGFVDRAIVTAALPDGGRQMVLLDMEQSPGRVDQAVWRPLGMKASASGIITFTGVDVDRASLIGEPDDYFRQPWFSAGAIRFAAAQLGGTAALIDAARSDLRGLDRMEDVAQRLRASHAAIAIESGMLWLDRAAELADRSSFGGANVSEISDREMVAYVNMARTAIERICLDAIEYAQRSVGARSLLQPHPIERISRDLGLYLRQSGIDAAVHDSGDVAIKQPGSLLDAWGRT